VTGYWVWVSVALATESGKANNRVGIKDHFIGRLLLKINGYGVIQL
jgi:hypothetical protein